MPLLQVKDLSVTLSGRGIVERLNLTITPKKVTAIIGPNGCGKSTALRALSRIVKPHSGEVTLDGADIWGMMPQSYARSVALLPQNPQTPEGIRVRALVERGRTPHLGPFRPLTSADVAAVDRAIAFTGLESLQTRRVDRLSGGQRQRAWIALTLAQQTPILLLDEPTTYLDLPRQIELLRLVRKLNSETGQTIVMVLHDINLASQYADTIVALRDGKKLFEGPPTEVITSETMHSLFDMDLVVTSREGGAAPMILPQ